MATYNFNRELAQMGIKPPESASWNAVQPVVIPDAVKSFAEQSGVNLDELRDEVATKNYYERQTGINDSPLLVDIAVQTDGYSSYKEAVAENTKPYTVLGAFNPLNYFGKDRLKMPTIGNFFKLGYLNFQSGSLSAKRGLAVSDYLSSTRMLDPMLEVEAVEGDFEKAQNPLAQFYISSGIAKGTSASDVQNRIDNTRKRLEIYNDKQLEIEASLEEVPMDQRMSLGGLIATTTGEIPQAGLYMIPVFGLAAGTSYNALRYYDEAYFEYYNKYLNDGIDPYQAEEMASAEAAGFSAIFSIAGSVVDKLKLSTGTKALKASTKAGRKTFFTRQLGLSKQAQQGAVGEFITEVAESVYLQSETRDEINFEEAINNGIMGYIGGLTAGQAFGNVNRGVMKVKLARNGIPPEIAQRMLDANNEVEARDILKEYLTEEARALSKQLDQAAAIELAQQKENLLITKGFAHRIANSKTQEEIADIVLQNEYIQDDPEAQRLLINALTSGKAEDVDAFNDYAAENIIMPTVESAINPEVTPEAEESREFDPQDPFKNLKVVPKEEPTTAVEPAVDAEIETTPIVDLDLDTASWAEIRAEAKRLGIKASGKGVTKESLITEINNRRAKPEPEVKEKTQSEIKKEEVAKKIQELEAQLADPKIPNEEKENLKIQLHFSLSDLQMLIGAETLNATSKNISNIEKLRIRRDAALKELEILNKQIPLYPSLGFGNVQYVKEQIKIIENSVKIYENEINQELETTASQEVAEAELDKDLENDTYEGEETIENDTDEVAETARERSRLLESSGSKWLTPLLSKVKDISTKVYSRLVRFEYDISTRKASYHARVKPFIDEFIQLQRSNPVGASVVDLALKNGDYNTVLEFISADSVNQMRSALADLRQLLIKSGYDVADRENYFPNKVADYEGLRDLFGKPLGDIIDQAYREQARKLGLFDANGEPDVGMLTEGQKEKIANSVILGTYRGKGIKMPKSVNQRVVKNIDSEMNEFYFGAIEALNMHISEIIEQTAMREFFGKGVNIRQDEDLAGSEKSVGALIAELKDKYGLSEQDAKELREGLNARFNTRATGKTVQALKSAAYIEMLSDIENVITQFGDFAYTLFSNGFYRTIKAMGSKKRLTIEDLGIERISEDLREMGLLNFVGQIFKYTGFKRIDKFNKETFIEATRRTIQAQLKKGKLSRENEERLSILFPDPKVRKQVEQDFIDGNMTEGVREVLFEAILGVQPISKSNMPVKYLEMPNGRFLYTLKTFTLKQLDNYRKVGLDDMNNGIKNSDAKQFARGFGNFAHLAALFFMLGAGSDAIKYLIRGKKIKMTDLMFDNLWKTFGLYRYSTEKALISGSPSEAVIRNVAPPIPIIDRVTKDFITLAKKGFDNISIKDLESIRIIPIFGDRIYFDIGKGRVSELKEREKTAEEERFEAIHGMSKEEFKKWEIEQGLKADPIYLEEKERDALMRKYQ